MTDRKSRRVVIINNINSETIDQAIFILKSDKKDAVISRGRETDIVCEAQSIINSYVRQVERLKVGIPEKNTARKKKRKRINPVFAAVTALFCLALCFAVVGYVIA